MQPSDVTRAVNSTLALASDLGLHADDAVVLQNSNNLALHLLPCDVMARVAHGKREVAQYEVDLAQLLATTECPAAELHPRVQPLVYETDGFTITLWTYYEPMAAGEPSPADYAEALARLHTGMRTLDAVTQHFTDRVVHAQHLVEQRERTPALNDADRELLVRTLKASTDAISTLGAPEQLLHGEPHPGNVLSTKNGLVFIDLETCCRGPVEFDLVHAPEAVQACYPGANQDVLRECARLVLAMVATWRWDADDEFPNGEAAGYELLAALRDGPPWQSLDSIFRGAGAT